MLCAGGSQFSERYIFAVWLLEPFGQLNSGIHDTFVAVLRDHAAPGAFAKYRVIFLGHEQPVLRQLGHVILEIIHCFGAGNVIGQIREEMSKYLGAHDLMDPYLPPTFSFQIKVAEQVFHFVRVKREARDTQ
jgi:hypothetical protein